MTITAGVLMALFSVKDPAYGAVGNGVADDTAAIQAAIDAAAVAGTGGNTKGNIVFFPCGTYKVTSSLSNNNAGTYVQLIGAGNSSTIIRGDIYPGFTINQDYGGTTTGYILVIKDLQVSNDHAGSNTAVDASYGAIRFNVNTSSLIENVQLGGTNGIVATPFGFNTIFKNVFGTGNGGGHVSGQLGFGSFGVAVSQVTMIGCAFNGYGTGVCLSNGGPTMIGTRTEGCDIGVRYGYDPTGVGSSVIAFSVQGHTTERCSTSHLISLASGGIISGCSVGATRAPAQYLRFPSGSAVWSGGTMTITSPVPLGWSGTKTVFIEGLTFTLTDPNGQFTATSTGASTFTYTTANPGTIGYSLSPDWSILPQYNLQVIGGSDIIVAGCLFSSSAEVAGIDLSSGTITNFTFVSTTGNSQGFGSNWAMPSTTQQPFATYINCDNPNNAFLFGYLPTSPIEGMVFGITDGAKSGGGTAAWNDALQGGGTQHILARYNGSAWVAA